MKRSPRSTAFWNLTTTLFVVAALGCGGEKPQGASDKPPVYKATAKVTYKGKPLDGVLVKLLNTEPFKPGAVGLTNAQGDCAFMTFDANDGAPAGKYMVLVAKPPKTTATPKGGGDDSANYVPPPENPVAPPAAAKSELPEKYNNPARTTLNAVVTEDGPNAFTFDLVD